MASTAPGQQAALASPNEQFVMVLHPNGKLDIKDRATGQLLFNAGPFSGCQAPFGLTMLSNGMLALTDKAGVATWTSNSACRGDASCYTYELQGAC